MANDAFPPPFIATEDGGGVAAAAAAVAAAAAAIIYHPEITMKREDAESLPIFYWAINLTGAQRCKYIMNEFQYVPRCC